MAEYKSTTTTTEIVTTTTTTETTRQEMTSYTITTTTETVTTRTTTTSHHINIPQSTIPPTSLQLLSSSSSTSEESDGNNFSPITPTSHVEPTTLNVWLNTTSYPRTIPQSTISSKPLPSTSSSSSSSAIRPTSLQLPSTSTSASGVGISDTCSISPVSDIPSPDPATDTIIIFRNDDNDDNSDNYNSDNDDNSDNDNSDNDDNSDNYDSDNDDYYDNDIMYSYDNLQDSAAAVVIMEGLSYSIPETLYSNYFQNVISDAIINNNIDLLRRSEHILSTFNYVDFVEDFISAYSQEPHEIWHRINGFTIQQLEYIRERITNLDDINLYIIDFCDSTINNLRDNDDNDLMYYDNLQDSAAAVVIMEGLSYSIPENLYSIFFRNVISDAINNDHIDLLRRSEHILSAFNFDDFLQEFIAADSDEPHEIWHRVNRFTIQQLEYIRDRTTNLDIIDFCHSTINNLENH